MGIYNFGDGRASWPNGRIVKSIPHDAKGQVNSPGFH
jgi:hypothetical protein